MHGHIPTLMEEAAVQEPTCSSGGFGVLLKDVGTVSGGAGK